MTAVCYLCFQLPCPTVTSYWKHKHCVSPCTRLIIYFTFWYSSFVVCCSLPNTGEIATHHYYEYYWLLYKVVLTCTRNARPDRACLAHGRPLACGYGAQAATTTVIHACSTAFFRVVLLLEITASKYIYSTSASWSLIHALFWAPRRCCKSWGRGPGGCGLFFKSCALCGADESLHAAAALFSVCHNLASYQSCFFYISCIRRP